jgi:hypothetical protein
MAETVIKPKGGTAASFDMNFKACLKLQKESGYWGYRNKMFIIVSFKYQIPPAAMSY